MPPPVHGAAMMGKYIHDSKLVNESFECHYINLTTAKNLEDIGHFRMGKLFDFLHLLQHIRKSIKAIRPDLVYITPNAKAPAFYKDYIVVQLIKMAGCKVVLHYHNKGIATRQNFWRDNQLYKRFFKGVKVILLADALYPDVRKYVKRENVYICPNGIPDTVNHTLCKDTHTIDKTHILFLSNLIISKGVLVLLDALEILKRKGYQFFCNFVGGETVEIDAKRFQEEVKSRGLDDSVRYDGKKYGDDKEQFYSNADIFCFPTFYPNECFPLVLLEAMQHGVACVSTNEGGIPQIIDEGKNGFMVPKQDPNALADAISRLITDRELCKKMGENGLEKYLNEFTLDNFEKHFVEILKDVLH